MSGRRWLLLCVLTAVALAGCDWAQVGFDPANTSHNTADPVITTSSSFSVAWSRPCACAGRVLVAGGLAYAAGAGGVHAFNAANGTPAWSAALSSPRLDAVANGLVYLLVGRSVVALDAQSGAPRWAVAPPAPGSGTVSVTHLIVDGALAFVDATSAIANADPVSEISAVDTAGRIVWSVTPGGSSGGFAGVARGTQADSSARTLDVVSLLPATTFGTFVLTQYDEASGALVEQMVLTPPAPAATSPGVDGVGAANGLVYFREPGAAGAAAAGLFAVDPASPALRWQAFGNDAFALDASVVVSNVDDRGSLSEEGLDPASGHAVWGPVATGSMPSVAGSVVLTTNGGAIVARALANGVPVATFKPQSDSLTGPVTPSNGRLYVLSTAGQLDAIAATSS